MQYINEYARPFCFEGSREGCLLIHGFSGSPGHMLPLGEFLSNLGYTMEGILLKGHGTCLEDMENTGWEDWWQDAQDAYWRLRKKCDKVYIFGLSMGAILSLLLAQHYMVDGIVCISASIKIYDRLAPCACAFKYIKRFNMWPPASSGSEIEKKYGVGYGGVPVKCVPSLLKLIKMAEKGLGKVHCPILVVQSRKDETVKPISADLIYHGVGSEQKILLWLDNSKHVCTLGPEKEMLYTKIQEFLSISI